MAPDDSIKRRGTRRGLRESLGWKRRSENKEHTDQVADSRIQHIFNDYSSVAGLTTYERKVSKVRDKVLEGGLGSFKDSDIKYALNTQYADGDPDLAYTLLELIEMSEAGQLLEYSPDVNILGAENNDGVTCYLDATLFAMFAQIDDFERMLYHTFDDLPRKRLVVLLRLWVNLFRAGKLINKAFMGQLQSSLAQCGWHEAGLRQQQDASEAFNFITDVLDLPRLTLKKDMFHQGKADQDDHKYTNERTIDVAIPEPQEGKTVTLEECLMDYFDERVMVERQRQDVVARRNTIGTNPASLTRNPTQDGEKTNRALHIEVSELGDSNPGTPTEPLPSYDGRPQLTQFGRAQSIFEDKKSGPADDRALSPTRHNSLPGSVTRKRAPTTGKLVRMPAFQLFRLLPQYMEANPQSDLQVAQHFESKRPTIGICLKRFGQKPDGMFYKRAEKIDIPLETGIPEFLDDDNFSPTRFPSHRFKLSLQSMICHRGDTIQRGHYIAYSRVRPPKKGGPPPMDDSQCPIRSLQRNQDPWLKWDDLATPKVKFVDIKAELETECPYMLFYRIVLRDDSERTSRVSMDGRPPSYTSEGAESTTNTADTTTNTTDQETAPTALSVDLQRTKSGASSVISATSGPPIILHEQTAGQDRVAPVGVEPRSESIAVPESGSIRHIEQAAQHNRAHSVPPTATALPAVIASEVESEEEPKRESRRSIAANSSSESTSASGSIGRSLGSMFKTRSSSKGGASTSTDKTSLDAGTSAGPATPSLESLKAQPVPEDTSAQTVGEAKNPIQNERNSAPPRKSFDLVGGRASRKKEKGSHKRERSLADRLKLNGEKPDRECMLM